MKIRISILTIMLSLMFVCNVRDICAFDVSSIQTSTTLPTIIATKNNEFHINDEFEFCCFLREISKGNSFEDQIIKLDQDLDLEAVKLDQIWDDSDSDQMFKGTFDGQKHTLSNCNYSMSSNYVGLFRTAGGGATIQNLTLDSFNFVNTLDVTALLIGKAEGEITLQNINVKASTIKGNNNVALLVGQYKSKENEVLTIENCSTDNKSTVEAKGNNGAGILANATKDSSDLLIYNCINNALIETYNDNAGGIVGCVNSSLIKVEGNINNGKIISKNISGGIVGIATNEGKFKAIVSANINNGEINSNGYAGGIVGVVDLAYGIELYGNESHGTILSSNYAGGIVADIINTHNVSENKNICDATIKAEISGTLFGCYGEDKLQQDVETIKRSNFDFVTPLRIICVISLVVVIVTSARKRIKN